MQGKNEPQSLGSQPRPIAVTAHLFHLELWDSIDSRLQNIKQPFDLFVTTTHEKRELVEQLVLGKYPHVRILPCENRGRDVGPFLQALDCFDIYRYDTVLKIHTKRSPHLGQDGGIWFNSLLDRLIGDADTVNWVVGKFRSFREIGMLIHSDSGCWAHEPGDRNQAWLDKLIRRMRLGNLQGQKNWVFGAGTMFWFRGAALLPIRELGIVPDDFEDELGQLDGTLAHALERAVPLVVQKSGHLVLVANYPHHITATAIRTEINKFLKQRNKQGGTNKRTALSPLIKSLTGRVRE